MLFFPPVTVLNCIWYCCVTGPSAYCCKYNDNQTYRPVLKCIKLWKHCIQHWNFLAWIFTILLHFCILEPQPFTRPPSERKMRCYNIQMAVPSPRLPTVDVHEEGSVTCLRYKGEMMKLNTQHMMKLVSRFFFFLLFQPCFMSVEVPEFCLVWNIWIFLKINYIHENSITWWRIEHLWILHHF